MNRVEVASAIQVRVVDNIYMVLGKIVNPYNIIESTPSLQREMRFTWL